IHVNAYKVAGLIPGSLSLILADHLSWTWVFWITGLFMLPGWLLTVLVREPLSETVAPPSLRQAVVEPFREFIGRAGGREAMLVLAFIFFYKLGDSMATSLATPFYMDLGYSKTQIGLIAKNAGLWPNLAGGFLGGLGLMRLGLRRALWVFGIIQALVIPGFAWLAGTPPDSVHLAWVIGSEAFGVGLGTSAFVAYIATLTHPAYAATQFALFTSLAATPRTLANALAGFLVEGGEMRWGGVDVVQFAGWGWQNFYWFCFVLALPGLLLLVRVAPRQ
ncbi:MAG: MFS transporter, partial [Methylococcaceae bacterium]